MSLQAHKTLQVSHSNHCPPLVFSFPQTAIADLMLGGAAALSLFGTGSALPHSSPLAARQPQPRLPQARPQRRLWRVLARRQVGT